MKLSQIWLAVVVAVFCLPLFIGLGGRDLQGDEAGHSYSVDRILETGDWLVPIGSPSRDAPFLEKPPLKFWIVAAGIRAGLPHNEFGLRFWDAVFAGAAFLYLFGIGRRLAGPVCGAVAVLLLFVHGPLLFEHGVRANDMEAPLLLCYCGGVFHYLAWTTSDDPRRRRLHAIAVGLCFTLGFMVKFVAAIFLPMFLGMASLLVPDYRTRLIRDWRAWLNAGLIALALIAPWFIYATFLFGAEFWRIIFGAHVFARFTTYLDPAHVHPWNFYFTELNRWLAASGALSLTILGAVLLVGDLIRRRRPEALVIVLWFAVPIALISFGTSKPYHYAYPFLPPVALAGGYLAGFLWVTVRPPVERAMRRVGAFVDTRDIPGLTTLRRPVVRRLMLVVAGGAVVLMVGTLLYGPIVVTIRGTTVFKNTQLLRPGIVAAVLVTLGGLPELVARIGIPLLIVSIVPVSAYRDTLTRFGQEQHSLRSTRDCVLQVQSRPELSASGPRGLYVDAEGSDHATQFNHEYSYYFRQVQPWLRPNTLPAPTLHQYLYDPAEQRPMLISDSRYHAIMQGFRETEEAPSPSYAVFEGVALVLLPGPYAACGPEVIGPRPRG